LGSVGNTGLAQPAVPVPVEEAGCSCRNHARSSDGNWGLLLLTLGLVGYRRRRSSAALGASSPPERASH
jgi:MYXO-CTERM domain-containing protein